MATPQRDPAQEPADSAQHPTHEHDQRIHDEDYSLERVPLSGRRSFWKVGFVMLGFTFFSASMSVGASLGNGLDFPGFVWAVILGGLFLAIYTGFLGYIGAKTGLGMDLIAQRAFGFHGSYLPSALISFTQMGWFGVGVAMFALPASEQIGVNPWVIVIIAGALMTASAYFGIQAIEIVSFVSVPLIAALGTYSMVTAANEGGGLNAIFATSTGMALITGIGLVIGSFISGGTATPNFTRFARTTQSAVITTVVAFFLGNTLMFSFGAVGGAFTGRDDIFYVMIAQGLAIPALIVLGANIWTTNNNALYSSGLGFSNITKINKRPLVLAAGIFGTLASMWLYNNFITWLSFLSTALPPLGAILIVDYFRRKGDYEVPVAPGWSVNWGAVIGVILGGLVAWYVPWGVAPINAMVVALICYFIGAAVQPRPEPRHADAPLEAGPDRGNRR